MSVPRWKDGSGVGVCADNNTTPAIPVIHKFVIPDASSADYDIVVDEKIEVFHAILIKRGGNGTGTATLKNGTAQIFDALTLSNNQFNAQPLQATASNVINAGGTLRCSIVRTTGDGSCVIYVWALKVT